MYLSEQAQVARCQGQQSSTVCNFLISHRDKNMQFSPAGCLHFLFCTYAYFPPQELRRTEFTTDLQILLGFLSRCGITATFTLARHFTHTACVFIRKGPSSQIPEHSEASRGALATNTSETQLLHLAAMAGFPPQANSALAIISTQGRAARLGYPSQVSTCHFNMLKPVQIIAVNKLQ